MTTFYMRLLICSSYDLEGPVFNVCLNSGVIDLATNESLGIIDCISGVEGCLVLCCIACIAHGL